MLILNIFDFNDWCIGKCQFSAIQSSCYEYPQDYQRRSAQVTATVGWHKWYKNWTWDEKVLDSNLSRSFINKWCASLKNWIKKWMNLINFNNRLTTFPYFENEGITTTSKLLVVYIYIYKKSQDS